MVRIGERAAARYDRGKCREGTPLAGTQWHKLYAESIVLDIAIPARLRPLKRAITAGFDKENLGTLAALEQYADPRLAGATRPQPRGQRWTV